MTNKFQISSMACLALLVVGKQLLADAASPEGLALACQASPSKVPLTPNTPVWLDLTITNSGTATFTGQSCDIPDLGVLATQSPVTDLTRQKCLDKTMTEIVSSGFLIGPGKTAVFHVLLNDLIPDMKTGKLTGWVVMPLFDEVNQANTRFTLVAPYSVQIGPALSPGQIIAASKPILDDLESFNFQTRYTALESLGTLPDASAVRLLAQAIKDRQKHPWVGDLVDALGHRNRTSESTKALTDIAQSSDPVLSAQAQGYLKKANDGQTP